MISGYLVGDRELVARLRGLPSAAREPLRRAVQRLGFALQAKVQAEKLTGQVLKVRTGRLRSSINPLQAAGGDSRSRYAERGDIFEYYVGTNVVYGRTWEYGATIPAQVIEPKTKKALRFTIGGQEVFARRVNMPARTIAARPFLAPALAEMKSTIIRELESTLRAVARDHLLG